MLMLPIFVAGCGTKQTSDTKPTTPQVGIIDMGKAVENHPKYSEFLELGKQSDEIVAQLKTEQPAAASQVKMSQMNSDIPDQELNELSKALDQQFNAKMAAKQEELSPRLSKKADSIRLTLSEELSAYNNQIDKEYQPQIFNLELKLTTVQLTKEEGTLVQGQLEELRSKRSSAMNLKSEQLVGRMAEMMAPEKAAVEQELATYAKELHEELSKQFGIKQTEMTARNNEQQITTPQEQPINEKQEQLRMKQQEIEALQQFIIEDIREKTAKAAVENGFEVIVANVVVNVNAIDITSIVIAECNKE